MNAAWLERDRQGRDRDTIFEQARREGEREARSRATRSLGPYVLRRLIHVIGSAVPRPFAPVKSPPLTEQEGSTYPRLVELMRRLLAPDGCPWDKEQTMASLRRYVLEEACEVVDAIDREDMAELRDELGDLLLQVVFLGEVARERGDFGPDDVISAIVDKLVRRHPHVFGDLQLEGSEAVLDNWERLKAKEREHKTERRGVLDSIPKSMPALVRAQRMGEKVRRVGFDWPDASGPRAKVDEELGELDRAVLSGDSARIESEFGDALYALCNLGRHHGVDAEGALRGTMRTFERRFAHVEERVERDHGGFASHGKLPLEILDGYWEEAKGIERGALMVTSDAGDAATASEQQRTDRT
ncbi:MAG: nucleoside triphosphate pyrophosphohydrolase [Myxococcales bacterium]|nr:nucleoside triphosphate pyrophosphohydrolase [Myxococcales bacterium]